MMLKRARLTKEERLLVVSGMNYEKKDELYEQARTSLRKFKGDQAYVGGASAESGVAIKFEPTFLAQHEEALYTAGYQRVRNQNYRGRSRSRGSRGRRGGAGSGNRQRERERSESVKRRDEDGDASRRREDSNCDDESSKTSKTRKMNPVGSSGQVLTCIACGSFRHLLAECPDSWENLEKAYVCYSEEIELTNEHSEVIRNKEVEEKFEMDCEEIDVVLFTGGAKTDISALGKDTKNCMVLDSACTRNVCGKSWLYCYLDSLNKEDRTKLVFSKSDRVYKFGGGERLKSIALVSMPAFVNGVEIEIQTDVVESDIPLLWSSQDMKRAKVILNYQNDTAEVFGQLVHLTSTRSGHYCIPIAKQGEIEVEHVCIAKLENMNPKELHKNLLHLHRQFAHPPEEKLIKLLTDAGVWRKEYESVLKRIIDMCETCKEYARIPPRPVVALPMASRFNQKVAMDLKQWEDRWILHLIDMFTRLTVSVFVQRKKPDEIINKIMTHWVGAGFGVMEGILTDNGGEFSSEETREVCSVLNVVAATTAAQSPFQNGLCERVHSVTDMMLLKLRADNPNTDIDVLLCWACNARNSLQMWHGFSSYQLVFGQNPNLPNIMTDNPPALQGSTTSEVLATHINALHAARQAFIQSESSERIRRALRHKIRACEERFDNGDTVYYKREGKDRLLGPAKVVFQDGKVVFVRHGGVFVRVSPNHLIKAKNEFKSQTEDIKHSNDKVNDEDKHDSKRRVTFEDTNDDEDDGDTSGLGELGEIVESDQTNSATERTEPKNLPKKGEMIRVKQGEDASCSWEEFEVLSRGGKAGGKYNDWFNIVNNTTGEAKCVDLGAQDSWCPVLPDEEVNVVHVPREEQSKEECVKAKEAELQKLKDFDSYEVVQDLGQFWISSIWVLTRKEDGAVRARVVARGFDEETSTEKDSPTIGRSTLRLFFAVVSSLKWEICSTDIKSAFLQGKALDRDVYLTPPKEAGVPKGHLWKLKHPLYGLNDAARQFYQSVEECLLKAGCLKSKLDPALFIFIVQNSVQGLIACHVDDFSHAGTELFNKVIIEGAICKRLIIASKERRAFRYIGFNLKQSGDGSMTLDQNDYVNDLEVVSVSSERKQCSEMELNAEEKTQLRSIVGRMNWAVQGSRPDLAFDLTDLSTKFKSGKVSDLVKATKCIKKLKYEHSCLQFASLNKNDPWRIVVFSDASHGNLSQGTGSMGAHVIFLVDNGGKCCTVSWHGGKVKRVVRSTIAAEALSLCEAVEDAIFIKHILAEMLPTHSVKIVAFVDNRDVVDAVYSTKLVDDRRLRIDISSLKEFIVNEEISSIRWCPGSLQLANGMTKKGAKVDQLLNILQTGVLDLHGWE